MTARLGWADIPRVGMTTANKITIARILLVPVFVVELLNYTGSGREIHRWIALAVFLIAAIGDGVDGFVARRFNQKTEMGALLDPLADKLLLVLGLVILTLDNAPRAIDGESVMVSATCAHRARAVRGRLRGPRTLPGSRPDALATPMLRGWASPRAS